MLFASPGRRRRATPIMRNGRRRPAVGDGTPNAKWLRPEIRIGRRDFSDNRLSCHGDARAIGHRQFDHRRDVFGRLATGWPHPCPSTLINVPPRRNRRVWPLFRRVLPCPEAFYPRVAADWSSLCRRLGQFVAMRAESLTRAVQRSAAAVGRNATSRH